MSKATAASSSATGGGSAGPSSNWAALQKQLSKDPAPAKPKATQNPSKRARQASSSISSSRTGSVSSRSLVPAASILKSISATTASSPSKMAKASTSHSFPARPAHHKSAKPNASSSSASSPSTALGVQLLSLPIPSVTGTYSTNEPGVSNSFAKEALRKGLSVASGKVGKASTAAKANGKGKGREVLPVGLSVMAIHSSESVTGTGEEYVPADGTADGLLLTTLVTSTSTPDPTLYHGGDPFAPSPVPEISIPKSSTTGHPVRKGLAVDPISDKDMVLLNELRLMVAGRAEATLSEGKRAAGNYLAIDCEMVGTGPLGSESVLARVSIVNFHGAIILDAFVRPKERVTDWRTWVSGISESDMIGARGFEEVQREVAALVEGKVLIGHAFENDTKALLLSHPAPLTRDTQTFHALREVARNKRPGLKKLSELELGVKIQAGAHSSVTDARATMALYRIHKNEWEQAMRHQTDAYYATTKQARPGAPIVGEKRKAGDAVDAEKEEDLTKLSSKERKKRKFLEGKKDVAAAGGKTGISSGLSVVVTRPGGKEVAKARGPAREETADAGNWWE